MTTHTTTSPAIVGTTMAFSDDAMRRSLAVGNTLGLWIARLMGITGTAVSPASLEATS